MLTHAIRVHERGGPEAMRYDEVEIGEPGSGEVRIRNTAIGLNFIDPGHRAGIRLEARYETPFPMILGTEGAGVVEATGPGVRKVREGDRVAYWYSPPGGAYAVRRNYPVERLVKLPDGITEEVAAAVLLKGMTVNMLVHFPYRIRKGDTVLVHAAAGATGLLLVQWAKHLGATVIGTVGSDAKARLAAAHGCDHPIVYTRQNFVERVKRITKGAGVPVVYDSVGKDTFDGSLDCLRPRGTMVSFGNASGPIPPFNVLTLSAKGSLYLTRPTLFHFIDTQEGLKRTAGELFRVVRSGAVRIEVNQTYALKDAAAAHRDLEARKTTGSTVLLV